MTEEEIGSPWATNGVAVQATGLAGEHAGESTAPASQARVAQGPALPRGALGAWWAQGLRAALLLRTELSTLPLSGGVLSLLWLSLHLAGIGLERLYIEGPARFFWSALLLSPWLPMASALVAAWLSVRRPDVAPGEVGRQSLARWGLIAATGLPLLTMSALALLPQVRGMDGDDAVAVSVARVSVWLCVGWVCAAQGRLLWQGGTAHWRSRLAAVLVLIGSQLTLQVHSPVRYWYPAATAATEEADALPDFQLTQEVFEAQDEVLVDALDAVPAQRPGQVDVYAITFAPNAEEEVFARESHMVAEVMQQRFGTQAMELVSQRVAEPAWPWATPINLQRAIARAAEQMDVEEDVLFLHLTSHGGRNGHLATAFWPLEVDEVTPQDLKAWLDEAGIKHRVISVSACFSGSWIAPLADDDTLVMTAADADHTSYGCGRLSPLTFFGRAMYDEGLRQGLDFEAAHAQARELIARREKEAGKTDGYSNPQIAMGARMREKLVELKAQPATSP